MKRNLIHCWYYFLVLCIPVFCIAGELEVNSSTVLLMHFNNSAATASGTSPLIQKNITYQPGIFGDACVMNSDVQLEYALPDTLDLEQGSFEFWINPQWTGDEEHVMQIFNVLNIRVQINPGSFMKFIMLNDDSEAWRGVDISGWKTGKWRHVAVVWQLNGDMKIYIDGAEKSFCSTIEQDIPGNAADKIVIGSQDSNQNVIALIDEFRYSSIALSASKIAQTVMAAEFNVTSIAASLDTIRLFPEWTYIPNFQAETSIGALFFPPASLTWSSSNENMITVDSTGLMTAIESGETTVQGKWNEHVITVEVQIDPVLLEPRETVIDSFLANPAENAVYEMPVALLVFVPTQDGIMAELPPGELPTSLDDMETRILMLSRRTKFMLEEGSRFHGYKDSSAVPSLGYRVVKMMTFYEHMPQSRNPCGWNTLNRYPDYQKLFERINAEQWVDELGVKEFWIWYTGFNINGLGYELPESNMSSPLTGDVSNSEKRNDDLPVYNNTYCVYQYGWERLHCEAVHNHGHQLESILSHANFCQDGNNNLFVHDFMGLDSTETWQPGRAGWTHVTANNWREYIYDSDSLAWTDIEDWLPDNSGKKTLLNVDTWRSIQYQWPDEPVWFSKDSPYDMEFSLPEAQWYIYWMQNMPGYNDMRTYQEVFNDGKNDVIHEKKLTNWWQFTADWENAIQSGLGLYENVGITSIEQTGENLPEQISLHPVYPNPFNPTVTIVFDVLGKVDIEIIVYDLLGRQVDILTRDKWDAGTHRLLWDGSDSGSGVYFFVLQSSTCRVVRKGLLLK